MDANGLPIVGAAVDLSKVKDLTSNRPQRCNIFSFILKMSLCTPIFTVCETKLEDINTRIQKIETSLSILETKLSSIPGLENTSVTISTSPPVQIPQSNITIQDVEQTLPKTDVKDDETEIIMSVPQDVNNIAESEQSPILTVAKDPRYSKYFKLIQVGVPPLALRPKMLAEGLDPNLLDTPNAPAPPPSHNDVDSEFGPDSGSEDEFSD